MNIGVAIALVVTQATSQLWFGMLGPTGDMAQYFLRAGGLQTVRKSHLHLDGYWPIKVASIDSNLIVVLARKSGHKYLGAFSIGTSKVSNGLYTEVADDAETVACQSGLSVAYVLSPKTVAAYTIKWDGIGNLGSTHIDLPARGYAWSLAISPDKSLLLASNALFYSQGPKTDEFACVRLKRNGDLVEKPLVSEAKGVVGSLTLGAYWMESVDMVLENGQAHFYIRCFKSLNDLISSNPAKSPPLSQIGTFLFTENGRHAILWDRSGSLDWVSVPHTAESQRFGRLGIGIGDMRLIGNGRHLLVLERKPSGTRPKKAKVDLYQLNDAAPPTRKTSFRVPAPFADGQLLVPSN